jgi:hypothetical protein
MSFHHAKRMIPMQYFYLGKQAKEMSSPPQASTEKAKEHDFRIGELNPGLVGTDHLAMIESDKS